MDGLLPRVLLKTPETKHASSLTPEFTAVNQEVKIWLNSI